MGQIWKDVAMESGEMMDAVDGRGRGRGRDSLYFVPCPRDIFVPCREDRNGSAVNLFRPHNHPFPFCKSDFYHRRLRIFVFDLIPPVDDSNGPDHPSVLHSGCGGVHEALYSGLRRHR